MTPVSTDAAPFVVTEAAQRPARKDGSCFYCCREIGEQHLPGCVLIQRKVKVRATIEYEIPVPAHWAPADVERHRNDGSWCGSNFINELIGLEAKAGSSSNCLCSLVRFTFLEDAGSPYLDEA